MRKSDGFRGDTTSIFINWLQQWSHWPGFQRGEVRDTDERWAICPLSFHFAFPKHPPPRFGLRARVLLKAGTHSLWSKRCWWRASSQSSSSSLLSALKMRVWDPCGDGLMTDSLLDFWPDHSFSITRIRVSCSTQISRKITAGWKETSLTLQNEKIPQFWATSNVLQCN